MERIKEGSVRKGKGERDRNGEKKGRKEASMNKECNKRKGCREKGVFVSRNRNDSDGERL